MTTPLSVSFATATAGPISFPGMFSGWGVRYDETLTVSVAGDFVLGRDPTIGRWRKTFRAGSRGDAVGYNGSFTYPYNQVFSFPFGAATGTEAESVARIVTTAPTISLVDDGYGNAFPYISGGVRRDYRVKSIDYQLYGLNRHGVRILVPLPELPSGWGATMDPAPTHMDLFTGRFISTDVSDLNPDKTTDFPYFLLVGRNDGDPSPDTYARFRHGGGPDGRRLVNAIRPDSSYHSLLIDPVTNERFIVPTCRFYQSDGFAVWPEPYRKRFAGTARTWWPLDGSTDTVMRLMSQPYRPTVGPSVLATAAMSVSVTYGTGAGSSYGACYGTVDYDFSSVTIPDDCGYVYVEMYGAGAGWPFSDPGQAGYYITPPPPPGFSCDDVPGSEMCLGPLLRHGAAP